MNESRSSADALSDRQSELDQLLSDCGLPPVSDTSAVVASNDGNDWDELLDSLGGGDEAEKSAAGPPSGSVASNCANASEKLPDFRFRASGAHFRTGTSAKRRGAKPPSSDAVSERPQQSPAVCEVATDTGQFGNDSEELIGACVSEAMLREGRQIELGDMPSDPPLPALAEVMGQAPLPEKITRTDVSEPNQSGDVIGAPARDPGDESGGASVLPKASHTGISAASRCRERQLLARDLVQRKLLGDRRAAPGPNPFLKSLLVKIERAPRGVGADLNALIHSVQTEMGMLRRGAARRFTRREWIAPWVASCLIGLTSCAPFFHVTAGSEVQQLQHLAIGVERYIEEQGHPPTTLDQLAEFPRDAVSWPLEFWGVRNQQGLNEVAWITDGEDDFAIVLRTRDRAWVRYDEGHVRELD